MKKKITLLLLVLMVFGTAQAWAGPASCPLGNWADEKAQSESYPTKLMGMVVLGVDPILTSPINLVWYPYDHIANQDKKVIGLFTGLGEGVLETGEAIVSGAVNIVSSPIPGYHGIRYKHKKEAATV